MTQVLVYRVFLLHSLSNQGYFGLQMSKLGLSPQPHIDNSYITVGHKPNLFQVTKQIAKDPGPLVYRCLDYGQ